MTTTINYDGSLRCIAVHNQSGTQIMTDAPTDNRGKGEAFSPTDLVCTALGTCIITTMAIKASDMGIELKETKLEVQKHMSTTPPRRIVKIDVRLHFPELAISNNVKELLQKVGDTCPVTKSLAEGVELNVSYHWR